MPVAGPLVLLAIALVAVPWVFDEFFAYQLSLYLLYGMVGQGIALTWGRAGFLSLGQALFFGLGAYVSGFILKAAPQGLGWLALLPLAALLPALLAYVIGRLVFARRHESGPFFSLITLALVMLGFQFANQWSSVTGGFNGLAGIPDLPGLDRYSTLYWLIATLSVLVTGAFVWLDRTPLGTLWSAIAQNEDRLQFFGFATARLKALAFAISAFTAGLAGLLYAPQQGLVTPQATGFLLAAEFVIWTAVGGRTSPYGALLGAVVIGLLSSELRDRVAYWEVIVALVFIVVVLRYPGGLLAALGEAVGALGRLARQLGMRTAAVRDAAELRDAGEPDATAAPEFPVHPGGGSAILRFENVRVRLNEVDILDGLDLCIDSAGLHCVIGPNGAGKTSSFNALTGRLALSGGTIRFMARNVSGQAAVAVARLGVGRKFQIPSVFPALSVADNLRIAVWANRIGGRALLSRRSRQWRTPLWRLLEAEFPFLVEQARRPAGELSQGQRQMLELAMTALPEPRLLLLDEPCAGLSPAETRRQIEVIVKVVETLGATALVIEHDMAAVEAMAQRVHVLHQGRLLASGTLAEVQADPRVQAVYAGGRK